MTQSPPQETCHTLDLSGKFCPQVVLEVAECARALAAGTRLIVISTDPLSAVDIPLFALKAGHALEKLPPQAEALRYLLTLHAPAQNTLARDESHA